MHGLGVYYETLYILHVTHSKNSRMDQMMERRQKQQYLTSPRLSPILPVFFFLVVIRNLPELLC